MTDDEDGKYPDTHPMYWLRGIGYLLLATLALPALLGLAMWLGRPPN